MPTSSTSLALEVKVLSAEDLRIDHHSVKKNAFVIVKLDPLNYRATKVDALGGSYPSWDEKIAINLPKKAKNLTLEVLCRRSFLGDKLIGTARVPVSDFVVGYMPDNYLQCLSYRLKDRNGKKNGIINMSVRVRSSSKHKLKIPDGYVCSSSTHKVKMPDGYVCSSSTHKVKMADGCVRSSSKHKVKMPDGCVHSSSKHKLKMPDGYACSSSQQKLGAVAFDRKDFGVVTGIPVGYAYKGILMGL